MRKFAPLLFICLFVMTMGATCATTQNPYQTNLTIEAEVATVMEQYEAWYQLADAETRAQMSTIFDPAFDKLDLLMDTYHNMVAQGLTTEAILREINMLKTRIMIELAKQQEG